ncbi:MAG: hypothetical protein U9Q83_06235 [Bacteroidota bacterium]|nr:hypothetical protein [Bacteroidota bacterium]
MNRHEINVKNILHICKECRGKEIQGLLVSLKYHFLKTCECYFDENKLKPELLEEKERLYSIYLEDKKDVAGARYGAFQPIALKSNSQSRYYYVPSENKVYNLRQDIVVPSGHEFYNWFLAVKIAQTAPEALDDFLEYQLKHSYGFDIGLITKELMQNISIFKKKEVNDELKIFHSFPNPVNLFEYLERDTSQIKEIINSWFEHTTNNPNIIDKAKEQKFTRFIKEMANEPSAIFVQKIFPEDYKQYIQLYRTQWDYDSKINWPLTDWYLYEILKVFAKYSFSDLPLNKIIDFMIEKFKYKNKNFDRKTLKANIGNRTKLSKYDDFLKLLNKIEIKSGL